MRADTGTDTPTTRNRGTDPGTRAAVALCGVQFVDVLGVTVVVTALPRMLSDLGATASEGIAVVTTYAMFFGGLLMVAARLGDRIGHRRIVLLAMAGFAGASALAALSTSVWLLAAARAAQGVAAAASVPSALRLLTTVVPEGALRRRAVAGWSAAGATAGASGFVVGGVLTQLASWRAVFWAMIGLAVVLAAAVRRFVPPDDDTRSRSPIGWASGALLTAGVMGIVAGTSLLGTERPAVALALLVTAAGLLAVLGFTLVERRTAAPLVPPAARRERVLRWGAAASFVNTATTSSSLTVATIHLQDGLGLTPLAAAGLLVSCSLMAVAGSVVAPRLIGRIGWGRSLGAGLGVVAGANVLLVVRPTVLGVGVAAGLCGVGLGIASVAANDMGTAVPEAVKGVAAGALNTAAQVGTAVGTALVLLVATALRPGAGWAISAVLAAVTAVAAILRAPSGSPAPRSRPRSRRGADLRT